MYLSFEQGKKKTRSGEEVGEEGRRVKRGGGLRRVAACMWGSLRATLRVTLAADLKKEVFKHDGPRKGPQAKGGVRGVLGLSGVGASSFGFGGK